MEKDLALLNIYLQWKTGEKKLKKKKKIKPKAFLKLFFIDYFL